MILQSLYELYERLEKEPEYKLAPLGYSLQKIAFKVVIKPNGELHNVEDIREINKNKKFSTQLMVPGGSKTTGSGMNPGFLWDNTSYLLGFVPTDKKLEDKKIKRIKKSFEAFKNKHLSLENEINSRSFSAVCRFLEQWSPDRAGDYPFLSTVTGYGVFQIKGEPDYVHENNMVKSWWKKEIEKKGTESNVNQCLITGKNLPISKTHDPKIKGVIGGKAEALLVSYNEDAYESYGLKQSYNAPVSEDAVFRYATALNAILDGPMKSKHKLRLGDTTIAFWTDKPTSTEEVFKLFFDEGSPALEDEAQDETLRKKLEVFFNALRTGRDESSNIGSDPDSTKFYILGLSPNAARISVRFFYRTTIANLYDNLRTHFEDIKIKPEPARGKFKGDPEFPPSRQLLCQTARNPRKSKDKQSQKSTKNSKCESKDIPPILSGALLRAILTQTQYPQALFDAVIRRIHADRKVNYLRACIIKGHLVRNLKQEIPMSLDTQRKDTSYRLGRLFATLEKTQKDALGENINSTIRDRFYSSASATPGSVFPRLLRTYQHHLGKLEGGHKVNVEKLVQEIMDNMDDFPSHLNLAGQGLFALGYYQQMRDFYRSKKDKSSDAQEA